MANANMKSLKVKILSRNPNSVSDDFFPNDDAVKLLLYTCQTNDKNGICQRLKASTGVSIG